MRLVPCGACDRHVEVGESACPFCGAVRMPSRAVTLVRAAGKISRAAIFAGTAACWTSNSSPQYSMPPPGGQAGPLQPDPQQPPDPQQAQHDPVLSQQEPDGAPPNPSLAKPPRADRGTILGRVVNAASVRYPGVEVTIEGPMPSKVTKVITDKRGLFVLDNVQPGTYRVIIESARLSPSDPPISASLEVTAGRVATIVILGEATAVTSKPAPDYNCCKPYGAPPARRRIV